MYNKISFLNKLIVFTIYRLYDIIGKYDVFCLFNRIYCSRNYFL